MASAGTEVSVLQSTATVVPSVAPSVRTTSSIGEDWDLDLDEMLPEGRNKDAGAPSVAADTAAASASVLHIPGTTRRVSEGLPFRHQAYSRAGSSVLLARNAGLAGGSTTDSARLREQQAAQQAEAQSMPTTLPAHEDPVPAQHLPGKSETEAPNLLEAHQEETSLAATDSPAILLNLRALRSPDGGPRRSRTASQLKVTEPPAAGSSTMHLTPDRHPSLPRAVSLAPPDSLAGTPAAQAKPLSAAQAAASSGRDGSAVSHSPAPDRGHENSSDLASHGADAHQERHDCLEGQELRWAHRQIPHVGAGAATHLQPHTSTGQPLHQRMPPVLEHLHPGSKGENSSGLDGIGEAVVSQPATIQADVDAAAMTQHRAAEQMRQPRVEQCADLEAKQARLMAWERRLVRRASKVKHLQQAWAAERAAIVAQMIELAQMRAKAMHDSQLATDAQIALAHQTARLAASQSCLRGSSPVAAPTHTRDVADPGPAVLQADDGELNRMAASSPASVMLPSPSVSPIQPGRSHLGSQQPDPSAPHRRRQLSASTAHLPIADDSIENDRVLPPGAHTPTAGQGVTAVHQSQQLWQGPAQDITAAARELLPVRESLLSDQLVEASKRLVQAAERYNATRPDIAGAKVELHAAAMSFNDAAACAPDNAIICAALEVAQAGPHADILPADVTQLVSEAAATAQKAKKPKRSIWRCFRRSKS